MKISLTTLFYLIAFLAVSYFLREYLNAPKSFIISLIISLGIILALALQQSKYTKFVGGTLIVAHLIRIIGYFIPVYEKTPDIRQRYRRAPNIITAVPGNNTAGNASTIVTLEANGQLISGPLSDFIIPKPIYPGNRISTAAASVASDGRVLLGFRDGSSAQLFPQSTVTVQTLATDFTNLSGSATQLTLQGGVLSLQTRRRVYNPDQRAVRAGSIIFSCRECIIAYSGTRGTIASATPFSRSTTSAESEDIMLSGGVYTFSNSSALTTSNNKSLLTLLDNTRNATNNRRITYERNRNEYITNTWGRQLDASIIVSTFSKVKMALVGLFDRTYREKYDNLMLYEYIRGASDTIPPRFEEDKSFYEFTE